jgi:lactate dehydrogenase-like 2-hydroxyacid dehydrogenase
MTTAPIRMATAWAQVDVAHTPSSASKEITAEVEVGRIYKGKRRVGEGLRRVRRGAAGPGRSLVHVSGAGGRLRRLGDRGRATIGDEIEVKVHRRSIDGWAR